MTSLMCLALAIHFESGGETMDGKRMVGEVVMNRVESSEFPNSICGVVFAKSKNGKACAFSWTCDGKPDTPNTRKKEDRASWVESQKIAGEVIAGKNELGTEALFFHSSKMKRPKSWSKMKLLGRVGGHLFYK